MAVRTKISAPFRDFNTEVDQLERLDDENQKRLSAGVGRPATGTISNKQLCLLSESIFFASFRAFENFLEDVFILYTMGKPNLTNRSAKSHLSKPNFNLNRNIIKAGQRFIDWNTPSTVTKRAELLLHNGEPVKDVIANNANVLERMKKLRNHIAHNSAESENSYRSLLIDELNTLPIKIPTPGEFLNMSLPKNRSEYFLRFYIGKLKSIANDLVH